MDLFLSKGLFSVLHPITYFLSFAPHIPNCAWKSCNQGNEHPCNLRTGYCFSFHGPDNKVRWSLALEQAWRPIFFFFCIILVCNFSPLLLRRRKISSKGKKKAKSMHTAHCLGMQIMTLKGTTRGTIWVYVI